MKAGNSGARAHAPRAPHALRAIGVRALLAGASLAALLHARPAWSGWQTFGITDGLAALHVTAIAQDSSENLWFATTAGVSRYDGAAFRNFRQVDGLASNDVRAVLPDRAGRIWFGTGNGVSRLDHGTWTTFTSAQGLASDDVRAVIEDHAGRLWFATGFGVSRFDGTTWTTFRQTDGLVGDQLSCLFEDRAGNLWFGTQGSGLSRYDGTSWTSYTSLSTGGGLADDNIESIRETRDGTLWVGTRYGGLSHFDGTTWSTDLTAGALTLSEVSSLAEDSTGFLWIGTFAGVARFDGRSWRSYTTADGLASGAVTVLFIDSSGNRWFGTSDAGVSRYDGESWRTFTDAGLGTFGVQALLEDRNGQVWAGTFGAGVAHFDRASWSSVTFASTGGGLAANNVTAITQDSTGALWFGTSAGASRFDAGTWRTFTTADGLPVNNVTALACDSTGGVWIGTTQGLSRYDGATWTQYTTANGLPANRVRTLFVDRQNRVWCGTTVGVGRFASGLWTTFSPADGLAGANVYAILEDRRGAVWFGTQLGLSRLVGRTWTTFTKTDGLIDNFVVSLAETPDSVLWIGTSGVGLSRFDGLLWRSFTTESGLPDGTVNAAIVERSGSLWFATNAGAALHDPAHVTPQTVITAPPPALSANRLQTVRFAAAFRQVVGIEFATQLDTDPWSAWSSENTWVGKDLVDGVHTLRVAARDGYHHVDPTPAACTFEIAGTPPVPLITAPVFRQPVRDTLTITGTAAALRFRSLRLDVRPAGAATWDPPDATTLAQSTTPIVNGMLAKLGTRPLPDGDYELRLAVQDTLGLTGFAQVTFVVDNVAPFAAQTTPALVSALDGGDVFTTNREAHVYIPPRGLARDATVHLDPLDPADVPATLPDGSTRVAPGFAVGTEEGVAFDKTATLDLAVAGLVAPPGKRLAIYSAVAGGAWQRLGGTLDASGTRLSTPFSGAASYAIYAASDVDVAGPLRLSLTPRVFSSRGAFASSTVQIGFVLAKAATVRVTIHNRAGRLVRVVESGRSLGAGTNLVSWDGKDGERHDAESGLYLVTVEALGETHTQTLAVVR